MIKAKKIHIQGLVQGVGFRPFVYVLAQDYGIRGWVENRNDGVFIHAENTERILTGFVNAIVDRAPEASNIYSIEAKETIVENYSHFEIIKSENRSNEITEVSPDIAVCEKCLDDLENQSHRIDYPFINCTNCGPRFTIIRDLPYDREKTTMADFTMCKVCYGEYTDIYDRRFHAQPVACNNCGPIYLFDDGKNRINDIQSIIFQLQSLLKDGKIAAIKGLGGFHLACDALNENAVRKLRQSKKREGKPFAVMFSSLEEIRKYAEVSDQEADLLISWQRPIVLLKLKKKLATGVCNGLDKLGVMLPYMPFHFMLFKNLGLPAIVLTSGNISDEPIVIDNDLAMKDLFPISDVLVTYNRDIHNRTDDSVAFIVNGRSRLIRRSRGFVPSPIRLDLNTEGIFGAGAELVNCFCFGKEKQAILSQHIGDLKNPETLEFYTESFNRFKKLFRVNTEVVAHDLHPDYLSTKFAKSLGLKTIEIQHHHAHIASCMAEYGLDEKVIGVSFDGTGLGDDGNIWGGEFLLADLVEYQRYSHFEYIPMPGGDQVTKQPWRMAISYLYHYFGNEAFKNDLAFLAGKDEKDIEILLKAIDLKINTPLTSSSGRLFDAVSALLNICTESLFHAEAPMRLESCLISGINEYYGFKTGKAITFCKMFEEILFDLNKKTDVSIISTKFHNTVVRVILETVCQIREEMSLNRVILSGGTFQNQYLLEKVEKQLENNKFEVFSHMKVPSNDGGIALGQLAIAAKINSQS